jgi:hypothetical protein
MDDEQVGRLVEALADIYQEMPSPEHYETMERLLVRIAEALEQIALRMP